jgi:hypothetical protein
MNAGDSFQQLVAGLKLCPTLQTSITPSHLNETWASFQRIDPEHGDDLTPAMLVALILFDEESFAGLITEEQFDQLHIISGQVKQNYELAIKPKNKVGLLLAMTIKESEKL